MYKSHLIAFTLLAIALTWTATTTHAEKNAMNPESRIYQDAELGEMPYRVFKPKGYNPKKKYPLVLCLHGAGGRGTDNQSRGIQAFHALTAENVQKKYPAFVVSPQCPKDKKWVNTDWGVGSYSIASVQKSDQLKLVSKILEALQKEFNIDASRLYITGQSMGGYATWDMILRHPNLFAAAIPVCGGGDPTQVKSIKHLPIWTFHGDKDPTVPVAATRAMVAALKKVNGQIKYSELENVKHNAWIPAWQQTALIHWLYKQKKK